MSGSRVHTVANLRAALRGRAFKADDKGSSGYKQQQDDAVEAIEGVGLKPQELTKQERHLFASRSTSYLRARSKILLKWHQDCKHVVDLRELLDEADDNSLSITKDAYYFLQENGYINFGVLQEGEPPARAEAATADGAEKPQEQPQEQEAEESEAAIVFKLYELLRAADMESTSEKALRKELQKHFMTDINTKKALVKEHVNYFIHHLDQKATLKPKGYEGVTDPAKAAAAAEAKAQKEAAAKAAAKAKREAAAAPLPKPAGRVAVVGAGPAGLAAAVLLQRNNVDVVVLEARDRVGGRVHSYKGDFGAPVELGASLITGTQPVDGQAPDPVTLVCKQLGIQLHELQVELPLYDTAGRKVPADLDTTVEELREDLLDSAGNAADEEGAAQQSLGQALQQALQLRLKAAAAAAAPSSNGPGSEAAAADGQKGQHQQNGAVELEGQHQTESADPQQQQQQQQGGQEGTQEPSQEVTPRTKNKPALPPGLETKPDADKKQPYGELVAAAAAGAKPITADMLDVLDWHWANLEYGCGASLHEVSLPHWNQDEDWGGFGGPHAMVVGGFDQAMHGLSQQLGSKLHLSTPVTKIEYSEAADKQQQQPEQQQEGDIKPDSPAEQQQPEGPAAAVHVTTAGGQVYECSAVLVTLPLGVLKAGSVEFVPPLPDWKAEAVQGLGFGDLNKVVLQFPSVFWDGVDYFGITQPAGASSRGRCFMFWNLARFTGVPLLSALVSGQAARAAEDTSQQEMVQHMLQALRRVYGEAVPEPVASYATRWASDEFTRGSYSYVAVGCSGAEYDKLAAPVASKVLFAGEHTCKEHPDTVGGAMLSGMREAARALHLLRGASADVVDLVSARTATRSRAEKRRREEDEEDEELEEVEEDDDEYEAAESDEAGHNQRAKKEKTRQTKEKKKEKKVTREKKFFKKHKAGADAEASGDEDDKQGGRRGGRERRPAGPTPAELQSRQQQRQHLQQYLNRLWKGLIDAQKGDVFTVLDVLDKCSSLDERMQCVHALMRAPAEAVQYLSEHAKFLEVVCSWLAELLPERSDANLHVTKKLLELLAKLTSSWAAITAVPSMMDTIKAASEHRSKEVAQMGAAVRKSWVSRNPNKAAQQSAQRRPASAAQRSAVSQLMQQHKQRPGSAPAASTPALGPAAASPALAPAGSGDEIAELVDADKLQELEQAQAALLAAKEQAAREAALLAAMQQEPGLPQSGHMRFDTFGEYSRVAKRQQQDAEEEALEQQGLAKRSKHQHQQHGGQQHHHHHKQEKAAATAKLRPGSGRGGDAKDVATKELREYIKSRLKPRFQSKELDQEDCKWVLQKVQEKVLKNTSALEAGQPGFLTGKRGKKVAHLVDSYVDRRKVDVAREATAAAKAAPAAVAAAPVLLPAALPATAAAPPKPPTRSKWDQPS